MFKKKNWKWIHTNKVDCHHCRITGFLNNICFGKMRSAARRSWCGKPTVSYSIYIIVRFTDSCRRLLNLQWVSKKFEVVPVKAVNASSAVGEATPVVTNLENMRWGGGFMLRLFYHRRKSVRYKLSKRRGRPQSRSGTTTQKAWIPSSFLPNVQCKFNLLP